MKSLKSRCKFTFQFMVYSQWGFILPKPGDRIGFVCAYVRACDCWGTGQGVDAVGCFQMTALVWCESVACTCQPLSLPLFLCLSHIHTPTHTHAALRLKLSFSPLISPLGILWSGRLSAEWCLAQQVMTEAQWSSCEVHEHLMQKRASRGSLSATLTYTHRWILIASTCHTISCKLYRVGLRCVPQACKGLIHTPLSTLVLVFAVHLLITWKLRRALWRLLYDKYCYPPGSGLLVSLSHYSPFYKNPASSRILSLGSLSTACHCWSCSAVRATHSDLKTIKILDNSHKVFLLSSPKKRSLKGRIFFSPCF